MATTIPYPLDNNQVDDRTPYEQQLDGWLTYYECVITGDFLCAGELASLTADEMKGYNAAVRAADYAEFMAYRSNRNSFGDLTEY